MVQLERSLAQNGWPSLPKDALPHLGHQTAWASLGSPAKFCQRPISGGAYRQQPKLLLVLHRRRSATMVLSSTAAVSEYVIL